MRGRTVETRRFASRNSGLVPERATLLIARPSAPARSPCQRDFGAAPRLARLRRRHDEAMPPQPRPARNLLLNRLYDERECAHRRTHRRATAPMPRQVGRLLSRTRSGYPTSAEAVGRTRRCHFSLPKMDNKTVPSLMSLGSVKTPIEPVGKAAKSGARGKGAEAGARSRPVSPQSARQQPTNDDLPVPLPNTQATLPVPGSTPAEGSWHGDISQIGR